ncbi:UNVERIFIED_CONTAM: CDP-diacylglycerol--serine O-phosphatidyltransferase 1 [Sesamum radiatum]|uniref:CDP-diacylglycerol--serine O-phosphatidyltransferase n=1 Tax=Sesamum radiatum TaxID=300843 RepID=A0AAW2JSQ4_SESRA
MEHNGHRRARRKDRVAYQNGDLSTSSSEDELDPWTAWAYRPRTITLLLIGACFLVWSSGALDPERSSESDLVSSVKRGVWAMVAVFLAYCLLQAPSTVLIRPHPAIWRVVHGMAVIYLVALTFLLFQERDDARQFMKLLHPDLGVGKAFGPFTYSINNAELPERSYGADCRIYVPENPRSRFKNVYETLFDEFVVAHILGWWGKAIMIRNQPLLWVLSIGFELMELTFRHMLPNFNECWWDSIILDILICNWFGIWAGMRTVRYFDGRTYEWVGISRQPNIMSKMPNDLDSFYFLPFPMAECSCSLRYLKVYN